MKIRMSGLLAITTFAAGCALGSINSFADDVLFDDTFTSFKLGTRWEVPSYFGTAATAGTYFNCCTFLGGPNVVLKAVYGGLRMTSAQTTAELTAIATTDTFRINHGTVEVDLTTAAMSDPTLPLPAGVTRTNIDGVIDVGLLNKATGASIPVAQLFAGDFGTDRFLCARLGEPPYLQVCTNGPADWAYNTAYKIVITSQDDASQILFETAAGAVLYTYDVPFGLRDLGDFNIILAQNMGTPGSAYYNDIIVRRVTVTRGE
jgi:hypothetical protein